MSVHGAGMTNMFFMNPGSAVVEVIPYPLCNCDSPDYFYGVGGTCMWHDVTKHCMWIEFVFVSYSDDSLLCRFVSSSVPFFLAYLNSTYPILVSWLSFWPFSGYYHGSAVAANIRHYPYCVPPEDTIWHEKPKNLKDGSRCSWKYLHAGDTPVH